MIIQLEEAWEMLSRWQSDSASLFAFYYGTPMVKTSGRISEISSLAVSVSWEPWGTLVVPFLGATFKKAGESSEYASGLIFKFSGDDRFGLFELLPGKDFFPEFISDIH